MTSEYVSIGHPDKMADYISEYILDKHLEVDLNTRYALEVQVKDNFVSLAGEITSRANFSFDQLRDFTKEAITQIGYTHQYAEEWGKGNVIDPKEVEIDTHISLQSPDISQGVDNQGWGDQGIFWGMAVHNDRTNHMPKDYWLAKRIGETLYNMRYGGLDIKTQVTMNDDKVKRVVVAIPLKEDEHKETHIKSINELVLYLCDNKDVEIIVNGTGKYVRHSSMGDCGTTGRKLAVDFYGGNCRIGGGSPWTKDPTKADLTLNLYARKKALEHMMEHGLDECHCQIECCIGRKELDIHYYDGHMNLIGEENESKEARQIIEELNLRRPIYAQMAKNGMFSFVLV